MSRGCRHGADIDGTAPATLGRRGGNFAARAAERVRKRAPVVPFSIQRSTETCTQETGAACALKVRRGQWVGMRRQGPRTFESLQAMGATPTPNAPHSARFFSRSFAVAGFVYRCWGACLRSVRSPAVVRRHTSLVCVDRPCA